MASANSDDCVDGEEIIRVDLKLSEAERLELERTRNMSSVFDKDCPEITPGRTLKFRRVNPPRE